VVTSIVRNAITADRIDLQVAHKVEGLVHKLLSFSLIGVLVVCIAACGEDGDDSSPARGEAGESCGSRSDCVEGLACVDNRCVKPSSRDDDADGGGMAMTVVDTRGVAGESCTRRADCRTGNACIDNVCTDESALMGMMMPDVRGDRGESCQARNDCKGELACINQTCIENDFAFTVETKECFRVECEEDENCCENFVAPVNCPTLQDDCDGGNQTSCTLFDMQCKCIYTCQANVCVYPNVCTQDFDCGSGVLRCFNGRCAQCMTADDCTGMDQQCVAGFCSAGCRRDEQCPLFNECQSGECVEVGCKSARECYFATKNPLSECKDGSCSTPCTDDATCGELNVCNEGHCQFVGCETNDECRTLLGLANVPGSDRAVCREPDH
jgi:hypothetical protein